MDLREREMGSPPGRAGAGDCGSADPQLHVGRGGEEPRPLRAQEGCLRSLRTAQLAARVRSRLRSFGAWALPRGVLAAGAAGWAVGCSGDPRLPEGAYYSEANAGVPGVVLIDDMEDGNQNILSDDGLRGLWYIYNDGTPDSTQEPSSAFRMTLGVEAGGPERPCGATQETPFFAPEQQCLYVARTYGAGHTVWGAGLALDLKGDGGVKYPYNASRFCGVGFYARGDAELRLKVQDMFSTPESLSEAVRLRGPEVPRCDPQDGPACGAHFGANFTLTDEWQWYEFAFEDLRHETWGFPGADTTARLDPRFLVGLQFQVGLNDTSFDFSIDNVGFLENRRCTLQGLPLPRGSAK